MIIPQFINQPPTINLFDPQKWELTQKINELIEPLKSIANFLDYIFHPAKIAWLLWNWTLNVSYIVCLSIALFSLISYILGVKKYAKYVPWSIGIYTLIQAIGSAIK